jgi:hypothetical protein
MSNYYTTCRTRGPTCTGYLVLNVVLYPVVETPITLQPFIQLSDTSVSAPLASGGLGSVCMGALAPNIIWYPVARTPVGL